MSTKNRELRQTGLARLLRLPTAEVAEHCGPQENATGPPAFSKRYFGQMLFFGILAVTALILLISGPSTDSLSRGQFYLINLGALCACAGILMTRTGRFTLRVQPPRERLSLMSRAVGWFSVCLLPGSLYGGSWLLAAGLALALVATILLWQGNARVVLAWYLAPVAMLGLVAWLQIGFYRPDLIGIEVEPEHFELIPTIGCLFLLVWTIRLAIETHQYFLHVRKASEPDEPTVAPSLDP